MSDFKNDLKVNHDGFGLFYSRIDGDLKSMADISNFSKKLARLEASYAKDLQSLLGQSWKKTASELGTLKKSWDVWHEELGKVATFHEDLSKSLNDLSTEMDKNVKESNSTKKSVNKTGSRLTNEMNDALRNLKRAKDTYYKDHKTADSNEASYNAKKNDQNAKQKDIDKLNKKSVEARDRCQTSDVNYKKMLDAANTAQSKFYNSDMPSLLQKIQNFEEKRTTFFKDELTKYLSVLNNGPAIYTGVTKTMNEVSAAIDPKSDVAEFISTNKSAAVPVPEDILYEPYGGGPAIKRSTGGSGKNISIKKSDPVKSYGLTEDDQKLSAKEKEAKLQSQLSEIKDKIKSEIKSKKGLDKLTKFYASDPVAQQKAQQEAADQQAKVDKLKDEKKKILKQLAELDGGATGSGISVEAASPVSTREVVEVSEAAGAPLEEAEDYPEIEAKALFDYDAANDTELSFKAGDILIITEQDDSGWWYAELNGVQGFIPNNYVQVVSK
eukprot:TRINITY_DN7836_c0_g1_i1.p1 TRINITY_DN7836_c0_g1~~TRINITY_DN7836_c0_g1_i1.p1  ORF type:complete len:497 (+),score=118.82 TRINITY_DN7836_c0_g1_i1:97-1587(+)